MDFFDLAPNVDTLDDIPAELHGAYEALDSGGYALARWARDQRQKYELKLEEQRRAHAAELAALDDTISKSDKAIKLAAKRHAIGAALDEAGVPTRFWPAAAAVLLSELEIEVTNAGDGFETSVTSPWGKISVARAVNNWLASPDGDPFAPKQPTAAGEFAAAIRRLH